MKYHLAEACQNTFLLFDCLAQTDVDEAFLNEAHACLKKENRDDVLILLDGKTNGTTFSARMLVLGLDGTLAEFCGNGARAVAAYLFTHYPQYQKFFLLTPSGAHPLERHAEGIYSIKLPQPQFAWNEKFITHPEYLNHTYHYVEMLEPHLIFEGDLTDSALYSLGQKLNQRKDLFPRGINVNAYHVLDQDTLFVKTYERGVQRLTRSCGTGSLSCAAHYKSKGPLHVTTPGGNLEINVLDDGIELKGPAKIYS